MLKKVFPLHGVIDDISSGSTIMISGFGANVGSPLALIDELIAVIERSDIKDLTLIHNTSGSGNIGVSALLKTERIKKLICSYPREIDSDVFAQLYRSNRISLELVPQGTLAGRIYAAGAGLGAFYTPTAFGTELAEGKETREIEGRSYVLEYPLRADFALVYGYQADEIGNVIYQHTSRSFGPVMATAAQTTIVQVESVVPVGTLDPECIVTPSIYVDRIALNIH